MQRGGEDAVRGDREIQQREQSEGDVLGEPQENRGEEADGELGLAKLAGKGEPRHFVHELEVLEEAGSADAHEFDGQREEFDAEIVGVGVDVGVVRDELVEDTARHARRVLDELRRVRNASHIVAIVRQKTVPRHRVRQQHEHVIALVRGKPPADLHFLRVAHRTQRQRAVHAVEHCSDDRRRPAHVTPAFRMQKTAESTLPAVLASPKRPAQRAVQETLPRGSAEADGLLERREFGVPLAFDADVRGILAIPADLLDALRDPGGEPRVGVVVLALLQRLELGGGGNGVWEPRREGRNGSEESAVRLSGDFGGNLREEMSERVVRAIHLAGLADLREELERGIGEGRREGGADLGGLLLEAVGAEEVRRAAETAEEERTRDRLRAARAAQRRSEARRQRREPAARQREVQRVVVDGFEPENRGGERGREGERSEIAVEGEEGSRRLGFLAVGEDGEVVDAGAEENPPLLGIGVPRDLIGRPQPV